MSGEQRTAVQLRDLVKGESSNGPFFPFAEEYLERKKKTKRFNVASADGGRIEVIKSFAKNEVLTFQEIDHKFLQNIKAFLISNRDSEERTVQNYWVLIRTLYNQAIDGKLVKSKYYPFGRGGVKIKFPETLKIGLDQGEVIALRELDLNRYALRLQNR